MYLRTSLLVLSNNMKSAQSNTKQLIQVTENKLDRAVFTADVSDFNIEIGRSFVHQMFVRFCAIYVWHWSISETGVMERSSNNSIAKILRILYFALKVSKPVFYTTIPVYIFTLIFIVLLPHPLVAKGIVMSITGQ